MNKARWLVMAFLVCLLLLTPTDLEGLQLVGAIRNHLFLPASSPLHHLPDLLEEQPSLCITSLYTGQLGKVNQLWLDRRRNNVEEVRRRKSERSEVKMGGQRPLVAVMKKEKHGAAKKNSKESSGSSSMVIVGLAVASAALVALIGICCCACRDSASSSSPYDLRDDKPLLSLNLGDMSSGSSRKSSATPIDVSRLGALTSECQQQMDRGKPGTMSMKVSMQSQAMRMSSHEITTIAGAGRGNKLARGPPPFKKSAGTAAPAASVDASKAKLKPFFWDKVTANPNQTMVWDQIKAGSFQFNEEMIESLFGCQSTEKKSSDGKKELAAKEATQFVRILDPKKAQNLAISLKALSVSAEQVRAAVLEGHDLPPDLIQTLVRWSPTSDEELRLRLYTGERSQLGPAEQFMRAIIDVPYLYQRLDTLLFMASLPEEAAAVEQSFATLEVACQELRGSRLFKKLLEAVLKTGNRMNDGTFRGGAQAFKLDTLLKLADVKGVDGKITLLHFVVQEIIRSEGVRAARAASGGGSSSVGSISSAEDLIVLQTQSSIGSDSSSSDQQEYDETERYKQLGLGVVSSLGDDLQNVRKAACLDADALTISVASLGHRLVKANDFLSTGMRSLEEDSGAPPRRLASFVEQSQAQVTHLLEEEKKLRLLVRSTVDYFHGSTGKDEGLRLFVVVRDFLAILDKVCREVKEQAAAKASKKPTPAPRSRQSSQSSLSSSFRDPRQQLQDRRAAAQSRHSSSSSSSDSD
uniref:Formin-like protein n=1 Tax=Oryza brachyantha TaxID=4533 RepID=J3LV35_ORYBR